MELEHIARVVHEANRAVQQIQADHTIPVSPPWDELDEETRASTIDGIYGVWSGLSPEASHVNWMEFKISHGWTLGSVKDEVAKTHPLLVPYDQLPTDAKIKDHLFAAIVHTLTDEERTTLSADFAGTPVNEPVSSAPDPAPEPGPRRRFIRTLLQTLSGVAAALPAAMVAVNQYTEVVPATAVASILGIGAGFVVLASAAQNVWDSRHA